MVPENLLPHSQEPATCPYPEPEQSSTCPNPTSWRSILILSSHLVCFFLVVCFPQISSANTSSLPLHATCPSHLIFWFHHAYYICWRIQNVKFFVMYCTSLLHCPAKSQISSSAPYSWALSPYVPPAMCETKFHTHPKEHATFSSVNFDIIFSDSNLEDKRFCTECV